MPCRRLSSVTRSVTGFVSGKGGINYSNIALIHKIPGLTELNIGHAIISRATFVGLEAAVREMLTAMKDYPG